MPLCLLPNTGAARTLQIACIVAELSVSPGADRCVRCKRLAEAWEGAGAAMYVV